MAHKNRDFEMTNLKSQLESLLFISGDPLGIAKIRRILGNAVSEDEITASIKDLQAEYAERGIRIFLKDGMVQMVSSPENASLVASLVKSHMAEELTPAALETLAAICYREPISKADIDELRGVNSIFSLRSLLMRGLIEKTKEHTMPHYRTTLDFLKKLGIEDVKDLPDYNELSKHS